MSVGEVRTTEHRLAEIRAVVERRNAPIDAQFGARQSARYDLLEHAAEWVPELLGELDAQAARIVEMESVVRELAVDVAFNHERHRGDFSDCPNSACVRARAVLAGGKRTWDHLAEPEVSGGSL